MTIRSLDYLKSKYLTGAKPTQQDFHDWMESIYVFLSQAPVSHSEGALFYNQTKKALSYYNEVADVEVNIGQEVLIRVQNNTGTTLTNGTVVYPSGVLAGNILVDKADCKDKNKCRLVGMLTHDLANGAMGYVTRLGEVGGLDTSMFSQGNILYLDPATPGGLTTTRPDDGHYAIIIGAVKNVDAQTGAIVVDPNIAELTVEVTDTNGFPPPERTKTSLSVVNGTRTFTISASSYPFHYYVLGDKYQQTSAQSVVFPDTEGYVWIYFDNTGIKYKINPTPAEKKAIVLNQAYVANFYWDAVNKEVVFDVFDERHGISMSPATHVYLHLTRGSQYGSGYSPGDFVLDAAGDTNTHAQFSVSSGIFYDEDMDHNFAGKIVSDSIFVAYLEGAGPVVRGDTQTGFAVLNAPAGRLYYNQLNAGTWQLTEVPNNSFVLYHLFAMNGANEQIISIMGQAVYGTVAAAREGAINEINTILGLFTAEEGLPIATIIYQTADSYTNTVKARIRSTDEGDPYVDWRTTELARGNTPSSHLALSNVQQAGPGVTQGHVNEDLYNIILAGSNLQWEYDPITTAGDPGLGKFRVNAGQTAIYLSYVEYYRKDINEILNPLKSGAGIFIKAKINGNRSLVAALSADPTFETQYVSIPITVGESDPFTAGDICAFTFSNVSGAGGGGAAEREIVAATAWDGTKYDIDLSVEKQFTRTVNNGVTTLVFGLTFAGDSNTKSREIIVRVDNSGNSSAIASITFDDSSGTHEWRWSNGDPVTGLAAGAIMELVVRNISNTKVKALTDPEV